MNVVVYDMITLHIQMAHSFVLYTLIHMIFIHNIPLYSDIARYLCYKLLSRKSHRNTKHIIASICSQSDTCYSLTLVEAGKYII